MRSEAPRPEPLLTTLTRTGTIALIVGAVAARWMGGWLTAGLLMLWPSLGGHWVELWYLEYLRPRLPLTRPAQAGVRIIVWFIGGIGLAFGMRLTALALGRTRLARWPAWWIGGLGFIAIELVVHLALRLRGQPGFYNGRG